MAFTPVLRVVLATAVLGGCTASGVAVEDPHPDVQQEIWNDASRYDTAFKAGGMAGVSAEIERCYQDATVPVTKIWALRDCLIVDFTGFYTDMKVGRRINHASLPYFAPDTFETRTNRYAKMDGFTSAAQLSNYFTWQQSKCTISDEKSGRAKTRRSERATSARQACSNITRRIARRALRDD